MNRREVPGLQDVRSVRGTLAANEDYLLREHRGYTHTRNLAETVLNLAGNSPDLSSADRTQVLEQQGALLVAELGKPLDASARRDLAERLRDFADHVANTQPEMAQSAREQAVRATDEIASVELLLLELREARRRRIEELRQVIDVTSDPRVISECAGMIEEDIRASLAAGDTDGAHRATASLMAVRALMEPQEAEMDDPRDTARFLAASVVGDRANGIPADAMKWFERFIFSYISRIQGEDRDEDAMRAALNEYRAKESRTPVFNVSGVEPKTAFVDGR